MTCPSGPGLPQCWGFMVTIRHKTLVRAPLDEWSAHHRQLYLIVYNTHKRETTVLVARFKPTIPASKWPQIHPLDRGPLDRYLLLLCNLQILCTYKLLWGTAEAQWLRCRATNRKVAGSMPAGVSAFFIDIKSFRSHYDPGVKSTSNGNEYQEYFLGVKAAGA